MKYISTTLMLFSLLVTSNLFSQEGNTCKKAIEIEESYEAEHSMLFNENKKYYKFTAESDSVYLLLSEGLSGPFTDINVTNLYEYNGCGNLNQIYNHVVTDSTTTNYFEFHDLIENQEYILLLKRDINSALPLSYFHMSFQPFISYPCPANYNTSCGQLILNNNFDFVSVANVSSTTAFGNLPNTTGNTNSLVCEWERAFGTPELIGMNTTNPYARMWARSPNSGEGVMQNVSISPGNYIISFLIEGVNPAPKPDFFKIDFVKNSAYDPIKPYRQFLDYKNISTGKQNVLTLITSQIPNSGSNQRLTFCLTANDYYDKIIFYPEHTQWTTGNYTIKIDNIILKEFRNLDAGADVILQNCNSMIGPLCDYEGVSYSWTPSFGLSDPTIKNPIVSAIGNINYTLDITIPSVNGCVISDNILVTGVSFDAGDDLNLNSCDNIGRIGPDCIIPEALYQWSPSLGLSSNTVQNPLASPTITTIYTVTISLPNGNTSTDQVTVNLEYFNAGPDITLSGCNLPEQIGPSCIISGASYMWSPATGLSASNVVNPLANPTITTIYTVTVTTVGGATITDEVTVNPSTDIDYVVPNNYNINQLRSLPGISGNSLSNKKILIEGNLFVDEDFEFIDCSFYMAENAKVDIVGGSQLIIIERYGASFIKSCDPDKFWDGIYLTGNSNNDLLVRSVDFSGSYNGIVCSDDPKVFIVDVNFDRNNQVLYVNPDICNNRISLSECNIFCSSPLINASNSSYFPDYCIKIIDRRDGVWNGMGPIMITGSDGFNYSTIDASGGGIYIENSDVYVARYKFYNFNNSFYIPGALKQTTAITLKGSQSGSKPLIEIWSNYFLNSEMGIYATNQIDLNVNENKVNIDENGLVYSGTPGSTFMKVNNVSNIKTRLGHSNSIVYPPNLNRVAENEIYNVEHGIELFNSRYFHIYDNTFDMETQSTSDYTSKNNAFSVAIYANDYQPNPLPPTSPINNLVIDENSITHSKIGIQTDFIWADITNNSITDMNNAVDPPSFCYPYINPCPAIPTYGIRAMNHYVNITGNKVENDLSQYSGTAPNTQNKVVGISLENVNAIGYTNAGIVCNKVKNTGIGLRFAGNNINQPFGGTEIYNNRIENNEIGFALDNNADIGSSVGQSLVASENIWTNNSSDTWNFSSADPLNPGTHYVLSGSGLSIDPQDHAPNYFAMTKTTITGSNGYNCTAPARVRKPSKKQVSTTFSKSNGANGKWMRKGLVNDSAFYLNQQLLFHHLSKDSALYNHKQWKNFKDSMKNTSLGKAMKKNNRAVATQTNFDVNVLALENAVNKHFADSTLDSTDLNQLRIIAVKCPFTDGIAVYQARRILHQYGERFYVNDCETSQVAKKIKKKKKAGTSDELIEQLDFQLYPNPSTGEINILYEVKENEVISIQFYNVIGKLVFDSRLNQGEINRVNLEDLSQGVYFYRLINEGNTIKDGKLVIQ